MTSLPWSFQVLRYNIFMATFNEQDLVVRLRAGDEKAVLHWYRQYQSRLTAFVAHRVGSDHDVEELVQEAFINCLNNLPSFAGQSSLWTWMCAIAKHEIGDYYRKRYAKKVLHLLPLADWLLGDQESADSLFGLSTTELPEKFEHVWQKIGLYHKELLMEKYLDHLSVKQLAANRGKSVKAIESELFRARRAFKQAYQEINEN